VAALDVDHVEAGRGSIAGGRDIAVDQALHLGVAEHAGLVGRIHAVPSIEHRMMEGDSRGPARRCGL